MDIEGSNGSDEYYNTHKGKYKSIKKNKTQAFKLFVGSCKKLVKNCESSQKLKSNKTKLSLNRKIQCSG